MLKIFLIAGLVALGKGIRAQSILELTEQLALDAQKLASMKSTLQEMYRGFEDLQQGYTRIRDIAKGNFNLHEAFLDALWVVSPGVRNDPRIMDILNTEYSIVSGYKTAQAMLRANAVFSPQELDYIVATFSTLLQRCSQAVEELTMITTDNELRMSDAQRLQALDRIDTQVKGDLAFLQRFNNILSVEMALRQKEGGDINTLKLLYGLPN